MTAVNTIRWYVVWSARILLPIVYLLSIIRPVIIPSHPNSSHLLRVPSIPRTTALLVIAHSRPHYLQTCLQSVLSNHPNSSDWPIIVSQDQQDGLHPAVKSVIHAAIQLASRRNITIIPLEHAFSYDNPAYNPPASFVDTLSYRRISRHYHWALSRVFNMRLSAYRTRRVIIIEDDMKIAPDFFSYFHTLTPLLHSDPSLFCVSAWNDNGFSNRSGDERQLHRTDFFPGLGWMLTENVWHELSDKWPRMFWDDWIRHPHQMKGRFCIRPEVSRVVNFGSKGVSNSFHFRDYVSRVVMATGNVNFSTVDISYLKEAQYHHFFFSRLSNATLLNFSNYLTTRQVTGDVIARYPSKAGLQAIGKRTGIMTDDRNGVTRTSYKGVIVIPWNHHWAFILPRAWKPPKGYQLGSSTCC